MHGANLSDVNFSPMYGQTHAAIHLPIRMKLFINHLACAPRSVGSDGMVGYGGGTGIGWSPIQKAYGEFLERNHFFTSVKHSSIKTLKNLPSEALQHKLMEYCKQVQLSDKDCLTHSFHFAKVYHLIDNKKSEFFYNAISLNGIKSDSPFISFNDSCACAAHVSKENCLANSLNEFLERQALVGSWTSKKFRYSINPELLYEMVPYYQLLELLLCNGQLFVFENGVNLPGYSILIFYFSKSSKDIVQYAVGSSASLTFDGALRSAFQELWQCYMFQYDAENSSSLVDKAGSGYHLNFQKCNRLSIKNIIPFLQEPRTGKFDIHDKQDIVLLNPYTYNQAIHSLAKISKHLYYYHHYEKSLDIHYTKIVSPDFFMHMALDQPLNFDNLYAKSLGVTKDNAYKENIPFP